MTYHICYMSFGVYMRCTNERFMSASYEGMFDLAEVFIIMGILTWCAILANLFPEAIRFSLITIIISMLLIIICVWLS